MSITIPDRQTLHEVKAFLQRHRAGRALARAVA
jgi:hypothetical protein